MEDMESKSEMSCNISAHIRSEFSLVWQPDRNHCVWQMCCRTDIEAHPKVPRAQLYSLPHILTGQTAITEWFRLIKTLLTSEEDKRNKQPVLKLSSHLWTESEHPWAGRCSRTAFTIVTKSSHFPKLCPAESHMLQLWPFSPPASKTDFFFFLSLYIPCISTVDPDFIHCCWTGDFSSGAWIICHHQHLWEVPSENILTSQSMCLEALFPACLWLRKGRF